MNVHMSETDPVNQNQQASLVESATMAGRYSDPLSGCEEFYHVDPPVKLLPPLVRSFVSPLGTPRRAP